MEFSAHKTWYFIDSLIVWGETDVSEPWPSLAYCTGANVSVGSMVMMPAGITPDSSSTALWQSYQQRRLEHIGGMDEGMRISCVQYLRSSTVLLHVVKSYDMGPPALLVRPIRRKVCCGFLSPLKSIPSAGFEPATLGSSGKQTYHYPTEATDILFGEI
jgi:hypothetical protein